MKIILKEDVVNLGAMGDIVTVANGYARNYLVPRKFAVEANTKNIREFEHQKQVIAKKAMKIKAVSTQTADKLASLMLTIKAQVGEDDRLFGTITTKDIAEALDREGVEIDRKKIVLEEPVKRLGSYTAAVKLPFEVSAQVKFEVVSESRE